MDFYGIRIKGDFKTDNIKSKNGVLVFDIDDSTGKITLKTDLNIESGSPSGGHLLSDANGNCSFVSRSIPSNGIILFERDTVEIGYTLLTSIDDVVVYVTKGSAAGGNTGGSTSGAWNLSSHTNHRHTIVSYSGHTHTTTSTALNQSQLPSHYHYVCSNIESGSGDYIRFTFDTGGDSSYTLAGTNTACTGGLTINTGGGSGHNHTTGNGGSHHHGNNTGYNSFSNTWRPKGRNFTRQQKT